MAGITVMGMAMGMDTVITHRTFLIARKRKDSSVVKSHGV